MIIGHGNVALDVARILLSPPRVLQKTDITQYALDELATSKVKNVYIVGRRGVLQASFTVKEVRELSHIPGVRMDTTLPEDIPDPKKLPRIQQRIVQLLKKAPFIPNEMEDKSCRIEFLLNPTRFVGEKHIQAVEFEKQRLLEGTNPSSKIEGTGETETIKADMVFTSIGYTAIPLKGMDKLNIDVIKGIIPNESGRVTTTVTKDFGFVDKEAAMTERVPGVYVSGWVKTGPTGVIASTMYSAFETGDSLVEDWNEGREFLRTSMGVEKKGWEGFKKEVEKVGGKAVEWKGWKGIEEVESQRGETLGKEREKIVDIQEMVHIGRDIERS